MLHSDQMNEIATALSKAQKSIKGADKSASNPFFKSKYADLGSIIEAAREALTDNGLSVSQCPFSTENRIGVETMLLHSSGQWIISAIDLPMGDERGKSNAQVLGSIITYLRRYSYAAMVGVYADDDNDGQTTPKPIVSTAPPQQTVDQRAQQANAERVERNKGVEWEDFGDDQNKMLPGAPIPEMGLKAGGVPIPSKAQEKPRATVRAREWAGIIVKAIEAGYVPEARETPFRLLAVVYAAGIKEVTADNLDKVWFAISKHYEDKKAMQDALVAEVTA